MAKIDSLAKQNAAQAVRIADLEAQLSLYQQQQAQAQQGEGASEAEEFVPADDPVFEAVEEAH
jgi:hypothetical protein